VQSLLPVADPVDDADRGADGDDDAGPDHG
jgi:hypothetical protein